jgi:hypothetical protein
MSLISKQEQDRQDRYLAESLQDFSRCINDNLNNLGTHPRVSKTSSSSSSHKGTQRGNVEEKIIFLNHYIKDIRIRLDTDLENNNNRFDIQANKDTEIRFLKLKAKNEIDYLINKRSLYTGESLCTIETLEKKIDLLLKELNDNKAKEKTEKLREAKEMENLKKIVDELITDKDKKELTKMVFTKGEQESKEERHENPNLEIRVD